MHKHKHESPRLEWIADALMNEIEKPDDEIDWEYVKLCEKLLMSFTEQKKLSMWKAKKRLKQIFKRRSKETSAPIVRKIKPAFVALAAAVVLMLSCVTVCATTSFDENILKALNLGVNQSFEDDGVTYIYGGKSVSFKTIDELLDKENLNICYPEIFAYNAKLLEILRDESKTRTTFIFDDQRIAFLIEHDRKIDINQISDSEIINYNDHIFYILYSDLNVIANAVINNDFYILQCDNKDQLLEMIYSFNFERIE